MRFLIIILFSFSLPNLELKEPSEKLNQLLSSYVDSVGNVNYAGIIKNPVALNDYLQFLKHISPESKPNYFITEDAKKAYWINAYNAVILKLMIDNPGKDILNIGLFL